MNLRTEAAWLSCLDLSWYEYESSVVIHLLLKPFRIPSWGGKDEYANCSSLHGGESENDSLH
jgi:hypothetical protein